MRNILFVNLMALALLCITEVMQHEVADDRAIRHWYKCRRKWPQVCWWL